MTEPETPELELETDIYLPMKYCFSQINNAYLHAFEGRSDGVLNIRGELVGDYVNLSFTDNGVGIPEANLAKIWAKVRVLTFACRSSCLSWHVKRDRIIADCINFGLRL